MSPTKSSSKKVLFNLGSKHKNTMANLELQLKNIMNEKQNLHKEMQQLRSNKKVPPREIDVSPIRGQPAEIRPHSTTKKSRNFNKQADDNRVSTVSSIQEVLPNYTFKDGLPIQNQSMFEPNIYKKSAKKKKSVLGNFANPTKSWANKSMFTN